MMGTASELSSESLRREQFFVPERVQPQDDGDRENAKGGASVELRRRGVRREVGIHNVPSSIHHIRSEGKVRKCPRYCRYYFMARDFRLEEAILALPSISFVSQVPFKAREIAGLWLPFQFLCNDSIL